MTKQEQAMRLYQAVERLSLQAGEDVDETVEWLCKSGGMAKLFLYFSPIQPQTWIELDHDDIHALMNEFFYQGMQPSGVHFANFARAIEAKLKEKNT